MRDCGQLSLVTNVWRRVCKRGQGRTWRERYLSCFQSKACYVENRKARENINRKWIIHRITLRRSEAAVKASAQVAGLALASSAQPSSPKRKWDWVQKYVSVLYFKQRRWVCCLLCSGRQAYGKYEEPKGAGCQNLGTLTPLTGQFYIAPGYPDLFLLAIRSPTVFWHYQMSAGCWGIIVPSSLEHRVEENGEHCCSVFQSRKMTGPHSHRKTD